jgi:hypothetical protein
MGGVQISSDEISEGIKSLEIEPGNARHQWVFDLLPYIENFSREHAQHDMRMVDDAMPDFYWWPEHPGYTTWKEIQTSLDKELFLPRNLVDDLHITDWASAEKYLRSLQVMLYDELELAEYKETFLELAAPKA